MFYEQINYWATGQALNLIIGLFLGYTGNWMCPGATILGLFLKLAFFKMKSVCKDLWLNIRKKLRDVQQRAKGKSFCKQ